MSFPCGLSAAHEALGETDAGAGVFLERRSASTVLAVIKRPLELSADSTERQKLVEAERAVDAAFTEFEDDTPIGSMLAEIAGIISRKSSPSVIAFSSDYELLLGERKSALTMSKASISRNASRATSSGYRRCRFSTRNSRASKAVAVAIPGSALLSSRPLMMRSPFCSAESGFLKKSSFLPTANSSIVSA